MHEQGISIAYLTKKCKQAVKGWRIGPLPTKKAYTPEQKRGRLAWAREAEDKPMEYWLSTVFVDEHTFYRRPTPLPAIHIAGQRRSNRHVMKDKRLMRYRWQHPKLHFCYGVHWKLGVLGPYWISDCAGWRHRRQWKVSPPFASPALGSCGRRRGLGKHSPWRGRRGCRW